MRKGIHNCQCILIGLLLTGCGTIDRAVTGFTGGFTYKCSKAGVEYVQSDSGIAVHVNRSGKPIGCIP